MCWNYVPNLSEVEKFAGELGLLRFEYLTLYDLEHASRVLLYCGIICTKFTLGQPISSWNVTILWCWYVMNAVTLTFDPLTWKFVVLYVGQLWAKSNNPRQSYWRFSTFSSSNFCTLVCAVLPQTGRGHRRKVEEHSKKIVPPTLSICFRRLWSRVRLEYTVRLEYYITGCWKPGPRNWESSSLVCRYSSEQLGQVWVWRWLIEPGSRSQLTITLAYYLQLQEWLIHTSIAKAWRRTESGRLWRTS